MQRNAEGGFYCVNLRFRSHAQPQIILPNSLYALHNLYSALEDIFEHIAQTFENTIEHPARFHAELLRRMKLDVYKVRPAFLSDNGFSTLNELRAFRHVFRHAYDYELDGERVRTLAGKVLGAWVGLRKDKERFRQFLMRLIEAA